MRYWQGKARLLIIHEDDFPTVDDPASELSSTPSGVFLFGLITAFGVAGLATGILFLALAPYNQNPRIRFHAFQAILFNLAGIMAWFAIIPLGVDPPKYPASRRGPPAPAAAGPPAALATAAGRPL